MNKFQFFIGYGNEPIIPMELTLTPEQLNIYSRGWYEARSGLFSYSCPDYYDDDAIRM